MRPQYKRDDGPTQAANVDAAKRKVIFAPVDKLTPAMIDSIAGSHAKRGTPAFARLLAELTNTVEARRVNERRGSLG